jgi:hypothetical protein
MGLNANIFGIYPKNIAENWLFLEDTGQGLLTAT